MTSAFDQVTVDPRCLSQECEKQGCEVDLAGVPRPFHLIDMDRPGSPARGSRCDYLLVGADHGPNHDLYVVPLELKSSGFQAQAVSRQLAGGAKVADRDVPKARCRFVPIVAHHGAHRREINNLAKHPVRFRGKPHAIKLIRCGEEVVEALAYPPDKREKAAETVLEQAEVLSAARAEEPPPVLGFRPFPKRGDGVVTNELIDRLREETGD